MQASADAAMVIATHPTTRMHIVNVKRLLSCIPAQRVVISTSNEHLTRMKVAMEPLVKLHRVRVVGSKNEQYDTGKWCVGLHALHKEHHQYRWVMLANDSIFMLRAVPQLVAALVSGRYVMAGAVSSAMGWDLTTSSKTFHVQSYLRGFTRYGLHKWMNRSCALPSDHPSYRNKQALVEFHEVGSTQMFSRSRVFALFDGDAKAPDGHGKPWHANLTFWQEAWPRGFPVTKKRGVLSTCPANADEVLDPLPDPPSMAGEPEAADRKGGLEACLEGTFGRCTEARLL